MVYLLAQAAQGGGDLPLRNPNSQRSWLFVDDAIQGLLALAEKLIEKGPKAAGPWNFSAGAGGILSVSEFKNAFMESFRGVKAAELDLVNKGVSTHGILTLKKRKRNLAGPRNILRFRPHKTVQPGIKNIIRLSYLNRMF